MRAQRNADILLKMYRSVNLVSSESEDDEIVQNRAMTHINHPACRPNLYYAQTMLTDQNGTRLDELGLFTSEALPIGSFVGLYTGEWYDEQCYESLDDAERAARDRYAITTSDDEGNVIVSPPLQGARPNPMQHPMTTSNEPQEGRQANSILTTYRFLLDDVDTDPDTVDDERHDDEFVGVGLLVCRSVGRHQEIVWHYGASYARPRYKEGRTCNPPPRNRMQNPLDVIGRVPRNACSVDVLDG